jgi:hypothetical protein
MLIKGTKDTPFVYLSSDECKIEISGDSYSLKINSFYKQILDWADNELPKLNCNLHCLFYFNTINSDSVRMILEFIKKLNILKDEGKNIFILWKYDEDNDHIYDKGIDFSEISKNTFELVAMSSETICLI